MIEEVRNAEAYAGLLMLAWLAVPDWASAGMAPFSGKGGSGHDIVNLHGFDGNPLLHHVAPYATTDSYGLKTGFAWFGVGFVLVLAYQIYVYFMRWDKTRSDVH